MSSAAEQAAMSGVHPTAGSMAREPAAPPSDTHAASSSQGSDTRAHPSSSSAGADVAQQFQTERELGVGQSAAHGDDASAHSTGPPAKSTAAASDEAPVGSAKHVESLTSGLAGMVLTAPLAAVEKVSPAAAARLSSAGHTIGHYVSSVAHAKGGEGPTYVEKATAMAQAHLPTSLGGQAAESNVTQQVTDTAHQAKESVKNSLPDSTTSSNTTSAQQRSLVDQVKAYVPQALGGQAIYEPGAQAQSTATSSPSTSTQIESNAASDQPKPDSSSSPRDTSSVQEPLTGQTQHMTGLHNDDTTKEYQQANQTVQSVGSNLLGALATAPLAAAAALQPHAKRGLDTANEKLHQATTTQPGQPGYVESIKQTASHYLPSSLGGHQTQPHSSATDTAKSYMNTAADQAKQTKEHVASTTESTRSNVAEQASRAATVTGEQVRSALPESVVGQDRPSQDSSGNKTIGQKGAEVREQTKQSASDAYDATANPLNQTKQSTQQSGNTGTAKILGHYNSGDHSSSGAGTDSSSAKQAAEDLYNQAASQVTGQGTRTTSSHTQSDALYGAGHRTEGSAGYSYKEQDLGNKAVTETQSLPHQRQSEPYHLPTQHHHQQHHQHQGFDQSTLGQSNESGHVATSIGKQTVTDHGAYMPQSAPHHHHQSIGHGTHTSSSAQDLHPIGGSQTGYAAPIPHVSASAYTSADAYSTQPSSTAGAHSSSTGAGESRRH